jgi:hypothetical protein
MSTNLDLDALQHLADALTEDIVNTPGGMLLAEVLEDFGSTHALADEFDKTFDSAAQQTTKERLEARAGHHSLGPDIKAKIGQQLRAMYNDVVNQGVPERFSEILHRLEQADEAGADRKEQLSGLP